MSESENSELDLHEPVAFGQQLMLAREKAGMTVEEAARALNLKVETVEAIEDSAMDKLPPVAFVQGYVRSYARLLELPEERILREFEEEVPHEMESVLHPRPPSPDGANSQTPVVKLVSLMVVVLAVAVLVYALYSFYRERTEHIEQAQQAAEDAGTQPSPMEQAEPVAAEAPPLESVAGSSVQDAPGDSPEPEEPPATAEDIQAVQEGVDTALEEPAETPAAETPREVSIEEIIPVAKPQPMTGGDVLVVRSDEECWAEIVDANDIQMFYGMIKPGRDRKLTGQAPFDVFLGNAPAVTLSLNSIDIDMTKYIRSNNIAQFKVSVEDGRARFH